MGKAIHLPKGIGLGERMIVMDAADRNLLQIYQQERPDTNAVRTIAELVFEASAHLHEQTVRFASVGHDRHVVVRRPMRHRPAQLVEHVVLFTKQSRHPRGIRKGSRPVPEGASDGPVHVAVRPYPIKVRRRKLLD